MMRKLAIARWLALLFLPAILGLAQQPQVTIGMIVDGPGRRPGMSSELIRSEITNLLEGQFDVRFPDDKQLDGQWAAGRVRTALDQLLSDPEVDVVITVGVLGSLEAGSRGALPKPVLATAILFPEAFGIPYQERTRRGSGSGEPELYHVSGTENFSYTVFSAEFAHEIAALRELTPFRRLAVLSTAALTETAPELVEEFNRNVASLDLEITHVPVGDSVADAIARIPANTEAVYVTPLVHLDNSQFEQLVAALIERRLPSFSLWGRSEVVTGLLASLSVDREFGRTARRTAVNLHRILLGESAADLPVDLRQRQRLAINMTTARAVGVYPSWSLMTEAELIGQPQREGIRKLSLGAVVHEAEQVNLDLVAADRTVAAGEQQVREARSNLLPQLEVSARQVIIDKDRAAASFGSTGQFQTTGSFGLTQLIYSEQARAGYDIEQRLQRSREQERSQLRLDVILEAAQAYLNVLRAKTFERIQRENLERTRLNLELSVSRREVGTSGPGEVYRWQAEIANNRRDLIASNAQRNQAEIALNRILNRPSEEPFETVEIDLGDPDLGLNYEQLRPFINNQQSFRLFRRFVAERAIEAAPELARLDAAVSAQERAVLATKRAFYVPTVGVQASLTGVHNAGAGSEGPTFEVPGVEDFSLPLPGNFDWVVAANASLPLFNGGALRAQRSRAQIELDELTLQREATRQRIEQRVRSAMHKALSSWAAIDLSREAAEAAGNNFDLVYDSYGEGLVDIIRVVDAQNQALVADLVAANAVYDFLTDLMNLERAAGEFSYFRSPEERQEKLDQMEKFYEQEGLPVRRQ